MSLTTLLLLGCDGSDSTTCPATMYEAMHTNPCDLAEGTECTYDCGGCGGPQVSVCKNGAWQTTWWCECPADIGLHDSMPGDLTHDAGPPDAADLCCSQQGQIIPCSCPDAGIPCEDTRDFVECPAAGTCVPTGQACPGADAGPPPGDL